MKQEFKMTQAEMDNILRINKEVHNMPLMMIGDYTTSGQEKTVAINDYWKQLGEQYGFIWNTVESSSKGELFFLATPCRTNLQVEKDKRDADLRDELILIKKFQDRVLEIDNAVKLKQETIDDIARATAIRINEINKTLNND